MEKIKLKRYILLFLVVIFNFCSTKIIYAKDSNVFKANSDAVISIVDDSDSTNPVNPLNPSEPDNGNNTDNNNSTNNKGTLTLDVAPKSFNFGENYASNNAMKINANFSGNNGLQYLQVTDRRTSEDGWQLNVKQTKEFISNNGETLKGASITIPKGSARNSLMDDPSSTSNTGLITRSVSTSTNNGDQTIFSSPNNYDLGKGTSTSTWNANDVYLNIPKFASKKGNFSSELQWSLVAGAE